MQGAYSFALFAMLLISGRVQAPSQPAPSGSQQFPPFKVDVELVTLTATVEDAEGRSVAGLNQQDFQIFEDDVPQQISVFHNDEKVPISLGILFDTSGSMVDKIEGVEDAVLHFIETTIPEDEIFLTRFGNNDVQVVQDFTADRQQLRSALGRLRPRGGTPLYDAVITGLQFLQHGRHKKKALLIVTDGNDTTSRASLREAAASAQQSEAILYALGIGHGEQGSFGHSEGFNDEVDESALRSLTDPSGGRTIVLQGAHRRGGVDVVDQAAQQVGMELRGQYTLAYHPTNKAKDGTYRRIQIKLAAHPGYSVRTRAGYVAPPENNQQM